MTALTDAWKTINYIIVRDENGMTHSGFPKRIERLLDGVVSITLGKWGHDGPTVQYRLLGDGETLEPVR
jgi:hypothetical protein